MFTILGATMIGVALGLLGSGGSAITVPVLIYLVGHDAKQSIAESMAIVGLISLAAVVPYARARQVDWHSVWTFGLPGMAGTFLGAWIGGHSNEAIQLIVFGAVLVSSAYVMFRKASSEPPQSRPSRAPVWKIATEGLIVGVVTGFVGVGGGFLIVPALVLLGGLPMRLAVGTSLVIVSIKAAVGFAKYEQYLLAHEMSVDVGTISLFVLVGIVGSIAGKTLNARLSPQSLRRAFAVFLLALGAFVIANEGRKLVSHSETPPPHHPSMTPHRA